MSDNISHGFGFGFEITEAISKEHEDLDLWDLIEDDYPFLTYSIAGYHWDKALVRPNLVTIKATTSVTSGYNTAKVGGLLSIPPSGRKQLMSLAKRLNIEVLPNWFAWSYRG